MVPAAKGQRKPKKRIDKPRPGRNVRGVGGNRPPAPCAQEEEDPHLDDFDRALATLARAAGDDLKGFMVGDPSTISAAEVWEAGRTMAALYTGEADPPEEVIHEVISESKAQTLEAVWHVQASKTVTDPGARMRMIAWIESQTGRPLPLDPDEYGSEQAP